MRLKAKKNYDILCSIPYIIKTFGRKEIIKWVKRTKKKYSEEEVIFSREYYTKYRKLK